MSDKKPTPEELERMRSKLKGHKESVEHLDAVIREMKDEGWYDLSVSEKAFVHGLEDKCAKCNNSLDDCDCNSKKMPSYAVTHED